MTEHLPYPLITEPILKPKVWGGRRLARLGKALPDGVAIGESWEVADLGSTSASGGGGDAARSVIVNGSLAGQTIGEAMTLWGRGFLGEASPTPDGGFPLLVKYLDAREHLSVQVHPSPAYANSHPEAHLKTESWVVLDARRGARGEQPLIFKGLKPGVTRADLEAAIRDGTVPEVLASVPAVVGECHTLPSGTVHALGAGVLVGEVQTPSDTTFRVYDWVNEYDRADRELHIEAALECALFDEPPGATRWADAGRKVVAQTAYYTIEVVRMSAGESLPLVDPTSRDREGAGDMKTGRGCTGSLGPVVVMLVEGERMSITSRTGAFDSVELGSGQTAVVPVVCAHEAMIEVGLGATVVFARVGEQHDSE